MQCVSVLWLRFFSSSIMLCVCRKLNHISLNVLVSIWANSSAARENPLNPSQWGPGVLPLIISCFLRVCLRWSPALQNPIYFPHLLLSLCFTQNCLYWSPKSSFGSELEEARLWKYFPWEMDPNKGNEHNVSPRADCFGNPHFLFNNKQPPVSLLCQDVSDWLLVRAQRLAMVLCYL